MMFSKRLENLTPYVPGEQPQDRQYLKLNTNESPFPPSPRIEGFLRDFDIEALRRYPDPEFSKLRKRIAVRFGIKQDQVFVGNGSDEVLAFSFFSFFDSSQGKLLFPEFTYSFYSVYCDFFGIEYEKIPLTKEFQINLDDFLETRNACGVIFSNPNAPTGLLVPYEKVSDLLEKFPGDRVVVIDEAYIDFGGDSAVGLMDKYPNLLVIRTFSKSYCLAGLRLGFAMGNERLIQALFAAKDSFNSYPVDMLAQSIGEIAISHESYYSAIQNKIISNREVLAHALKENGWEVLDSKANFVFVRKEGMTGKEIYLKLKQRGILVRYFDVSGIMDFVRITIGSRDQMDALLGEINQCC